MEAMFIRLFGEEWVVVGDRWLRPVRGGSPEGDDDDDAGGGAGGDDDADDDSDAGDDDDDDDDRGRRAGGDAGDDDDDDDDTHVKVPRGEYERWKREMAEADKRRKAAEREARKREEKERRERGEWDEIIREKDERVVEVEAERDEARYQLDSFQRQHRVRAVGARLGLRDPDDLNRYLSEDETDDEQAIERAAKRLLRERPYLRQERPATGLPGGDGGGAGGLTIDDLKGKSTDWINANWTEVQKVLEASGASAVPR